MSTDIIRSIYSAFSLSFLSETLGDWTMFTVVRDGLQVHSTFQVITYITKDSECRTTKQLQLN